MADKDISLQSEEGMPPVTLGPGEETVGTILREARQRQNLDYARLEEATKLRPNVLESLENEEWERFSAPIFIKGFLRSYAKALGLNEEDVLRHYEREEPVKDTVPRPLSSLIPPRKKVSVLFIIPVLILILGFVVFSWRQYGNQRGTGVTLNAVIPKENRVKTTSLKRVHPAKMIPVKKAETHQEIPATPNRNGETAQVKQSEAASLQTAVSGQVKKENAASEAAVRVSRQQKAEILPITTKRSSEVKTLPAPVSQPLILKGDVTERTWMKVSVDGKEPKEYIFPPGSHPEWKANKGFEIVIGNAGGIALEINGRKLDNLGRHGQVVHLKLP